MHGSKNSGVLTKTFPGGAAYKAAATVPTASMCEWQRGSEEPSLPDSHSGSEGVLSTRVISTCAEMEASSPACGWGGVLGPHREEAASTRAHRQVTCRHLAVGASGLAALGSGPGGSPASRLGMGREGAESTATCLPGRVSPLCRGSTPT